MTEALQGRPKVFGSEELLQNPKEIPWTTCVVGRERKGKQKMKTSHPPPTGLLRFVLLSEIRQMGSCCCSTWPSGWSTQSICVEEQGEGTPGLLEENPIWAKGKAMSPANRIIYSSWAPSVSPGIISQVQFSRQSNPLHITTSYEYAY